MQNAEQRTGRNRTEDDSGVAAIGQRRGFRRVYGHFLKRVASGLPILEVGIRDSAGYTMVGLMQDNKRTGIGKGKRLQQNRVDNSKHSAVNTDAEGERGYKNAGLYPLLSK